MHATVVIILCLIGCALLYGLSSTSKLVPLQHFNLHPGLHFPGSTHALCPQLDLASMSNRVSTLGIPSHLQAASALGLGQPWPGLQGVPSRSPASAPCPLPPSCGHSGHPGSRAWSGPLKRPAVSDSLGLNEGQNSSAELVLNIHCQAPGPERLIQAAWGAA